VRLNPASQLTVTATGDRNTMVKTLTMDVGELYARVARNERERSFQIQTPSGVAAVKGTTFIVRVAQDGTATVITLDGVVEFFNGAGTADVGEGQTVVVGTPNTAPQPRGTTAEDLASVQGLIDDDAGAATDDRVQVEVQVQDAEGRTRTIVMELPRDQARAILGGGN
jgi:ferric-dicitrate binding protein FerR (iron transport regulator)